MSKWKAVVLYDIADSVDYGVTASSTQEPVGPKFLRITDIQEGRVDWESVPWCECDEQTASNGRLKAGDIVFARTGATTGKSFLIRDCPANAVFASYLIRVRIGSRADTRYVSHFFQTSNYWAQITKGSRGVAQPGVNATTLKELEVPLPPLPEQRRIAEVLDRAEALRAKRRAALAQLDTLTQAIFLEMFGDPVTQEYVAETVEFGRLTARITYGFTCPMEHVTDGIPIITAKNIRHGFIDFQNCHYATDAQFESLTDKCKPVAGDLLITKDGAIRGRCAVVNTHAPFCISQAVALVRPDHSVATPVYLWSYIVSDRIQQKIMDMDKGVAMPHLQITELAKFPVRVPPLPLQHEFARRIAAVEQLRSSHRASLAQLDALFASLQHRAFRGEL